MNRTDRLLAILLELQARRYTRAEDLAQQFEVSTRTIYRDALALNEAGVPVVSTPGYGYSLAPGYFLPPLMLTPDEAGILLLGAAFVAEQVDAPYKSAVESARKKIEKLLPDATRNEVDFLQETLRFLPRQRPGDDKARAYLPSIRRAIAEQEVLHIAYQARHGEPSERDVEPHGLVYLEGRWILAAYCRARQGMRGFRLDRIDNITRLGEQFTRRTEFTLRHTPPSRRGEEDMVVLFSGEIVRWVREDLHYSFAREEPHPDGTVMVFHPKEADELIPWLLSWGGGARVLSPPQLRRQLGVAARAIAALYEDE